MGRIILCGLFVLLPQSHALVQPAEKNKEPFKGSRSDDHGDIAWESTAAKEGLNNWNFKRVVTNRDKDRRCKVTWTSGSVKSVATLKPLQTLSLTDDSLPSTPKEAKGEIVYNGGSAAGESKPALALSWLPESLAVGMTIEARTNAAIAFEYKKDLIQGQATAWSKLKKGGKEVKPNSIEYNLRVELPETPGVLIRWTTVESPAFLAANPGLIDEKTKAMRMKYTKHAYEMSAHVPIEGFLEPQVKGGVIRIMDELGELLVETSLPALVPSTK